jgi:hypothetical protein
VAAVRDEDGAGVVISRNLFVLLPPEHWYLPTGGTGSIMLLMRVSDHYKLESPKDGKFSFSSGHVFEWEGKKDITSNDKVAAACIRFFF